MADLRSRKIIGKAVNRKRKRTTTNLRISVLPNIAMKLNSAKLYINPRPISNPPIGIPNTGFFKVTKAIKNARTVGRGWGKSGRMDKPNSMLTNVIPNVKYFIHSGSGAFGFFFSTLTCFFLLGSQSLILDNRDVFVFKYSLPKTLFY